MTDVCDFKCLCDGPHLYRGWAWTVWVQLGICDQTSSTRKQAACLHPTDVHTHRIRVTRVFPTLPGLLHMSPACVLVCSLFCCGDGRVVTSDIRAASCDVCIFLFIICCRVWSDPPSLCACFSIADAHPDIHYDRPIAWRSSLRDMTVHTQACLMKVFLDLWNI